LKAAFVLFERMTALDFVGAYDPITRLRSMSIMPEFEFELCSFTPSARDDRGLRFSADRVGEPLAGYDLLVVPGGFGTIDLEGDEAFLGWLRTAAPVPLKASVCTGSVLLGAAGFLRGLRATTHPNFFDQLAPWCAEVVDERVVDEGAVVTSRGVSAGIDLGLHLVERLAGSEARVRIARQMDYPYRWSDA
jgi:transcriptional regulator GlxA family with amidase domain